VKVSEMLDRVCVEFPDIDFEIKGSIWKEVNKSSYEKFNNRGEPIKLASKEGIEFPIPILDLNLLKDCLLYHRQTKEPLPDRLVVDLLFEIDLALSGRESKIINKPAGITKRKVHPLLDFLQKLAVAYDANSTKFQYDKSPIRTLASVCGVDRSTVHSWKRKYPETEIPAFESARTAAVVLVLLKQFFVACKDY